MTNTVAIILPVSRDKYLKEVFQSLEALHCDLENTSLLVYVDGGLDLFEKARNFVRNSKFVEKVCIYRKKGLPNVSHMSSRRKRIGDIHKEIATYLTDNYEFVFLLEDDTLIPPYTLEVLLGDMRSMPNVGFVSGAELGRWGFVHIGAWKVDNLLDIKTITSIADGSGLQEVDAAGLYCCLTRRVNYIVGDFVPFEKILGPDVSYGLDLRRKGYTNYVNLDIQCVHKTPKEDIEFANNEIIQVKFDKMDSSRTGWKLSTL